MIKGVESEIKLLASEEMMAALRSHPLLAGDELCAELTTTYFDTHDGKLQRAGASLRLRSAGGHQEQTFKCPHAGSSSVRREEWSVPVSGAQPAPDLFPAKPSAAILKIVAGDPLVPIAVVTVERCTRRLNFGASRIEAAFDVGTISANGQRQLVSELELELLEGRFADCLSLAAALPLGPDLCWSVRSKAERCYGLAGGRNALAQRAKHVTLTPEMSLTEAFQRIVWNCLDHVLANYPLVLAAADAEALHQCRVAIRRLRSALGLFGDAVGGKQAQTYRKALQAIAAATNKAREMQVLLDKLADGSKQIAPIIEHRNQAMASAQAALGGAAFQRLLCECAVWAECVDASPQNLTHFAAHALSHQCHKIRHHAHHMDHMSDKGLHHLRIRVKNLRYAVEFFAGLYEGRACQDHAHLLGEIQDNLGALHDMSVEISQLRGRSLPHSLDHPDARRRKLLKSTTHLIAQERAFPHYWKAEGIRNMAKSDKHAHYEAELEELQIGLSAMQRQVIADGRKLLIIVEGRDAAGKDGTIKRIVEHMSPRDTRVIALGVPTERDRKSWYFQRWIAHLPVSGEVVLFNRSWYNRAGVERVMGFCTEVEYEDFMKSVVLFEQLLVHSGFTLLKYYLDISKGEQKRRLDDRGSDPLKQWKTSPIDKSATKNWKKYSAARNEMLARTHSVFAPWVVVKADNKPQARLAVIRDLLARSGVEDLDIRQLPDPSVAFMYDASALDNGWLAD